MLKLSCYNNIYKDLGVAYVFYAYDTILLYKSNLRNTVKSVLFCLKLDFNKIHLLVINTKFSNPKEAISLLYTKLTRL
jgi:hypothetical protein